MEASNRLLVVDDEPDLRTLYELTLLREGYSIETAAGVEDAWSLLQEERFAAVITDMRMPDGCGIDLLARLEQASRPEKVIVITAYGSPENAVQALKAGAFDYLTKPVDLKQFRQVIASAVGGAVRNVRTGLPGGQVRGSSAQRMAGDSAPMRQVRSLIGKVSRSMAPVMICGESGTGKELVARAIHQAGERSSGPFVAVNCGAIPETLLEAEFFGYRKGAFTGANEDREGFFQAARGGTLFLDEIGDLPMAMQSKLLRAVQERAVRPVGAMAELPTDVRLLSATHKDLAAEVQAGRFRQDLYYRLHVIEIRVPALRERLEDLESLCASILDRLAAEMRSRVRYTLSADAMALLRQQPFAGNVRELENLLHRAVALSSGEVISAEDLGLEPREPSARVDDTMPVIAASELARSSAEPEVLPGDLAGHLDEVERRILLQALERHRNNRTAAGASLGLTLRQMRYRMARLGIHLDGDTADEGPASPTAGAA